MFSVAINIFMFYKYPPIYKYMSNKHESSHGNLEDDLNWSKFIQKQRERTAKQDETWKKFYTKKMKELTSSPKKIMRDGLWIAFMQTFGMPIIHKYGHALETLNEEEMRDSYAEYNLVVPSSRDAKRYKEHGLTKIKIVFNSDTPFRFIVDLEPLTRQIQADKIEQFKPISAWVGNRTDESLTLIVSSKKQNVPTEAVSPIESKILEGIHISFYWKNAPTQYPLYKADLTFLSRHK